MNAKIKRIATIGSLLAATAAVSAHAADQTRFFEEQVQLTDSYVPDNRESATPERVWATTNQRRNSTGWRSRCA